MFLVFFEILYVDVLIFHDDKIALLSIDLLYRFSNALTNSLTGLLTHSLDVLTNFLMFCMNQVQNKLLLK